MFGKYITKGICFGVAGWETLSKTYCNTNISQNLNEDIKNVPVDFCCVLGWETSSETYYTTHPSKIQSKISVLETLLRLK